MSSVEVVLDVPERAARVLELLDGVPAGRVVTYGDVAEAVVRSGIPCGPRYVGAALARYGGASPWWRVLRAGGLPAAHESAEALRLLRAEGVPLRPGGERVDLGAARWPLP